MKNRYKKNKYSNAHLSQLWFIVVGRWKPFGKWKKNTSNKKKKKKAKRRFY